MTELIYPALGKAETEISNLITFHLSTPPNQRGKDGSLTREIYCFEKAEIETKNFDRFRRTFSAATDCDLHRKFFGSVSFVINGYGTQVEEIYEIPEVREYLLEAHQISPGWIFYGDLQNACLHGIVLCVLQNIVVTKTAEACFQVIAPISDLIAFFEVSARYAITIMASIGYDQDQIKSRLASAAAYFDLSFL